jgi:hypothetical protein
MAPHSRPSSSEQHELMLNPSHSSLHNRDLYFSQLQCPVVSSFSSTDIPEHAMNPLSAIPERLVSFSEVEAVVEGLSLDDYNPQEVRATWYDKEDLFQIRQQIRGVVCLHRSFPPMTDMRGLEAETTERLQEIQTNRLKSLYSVLAEQERQCQAGSKNSHQLGSIYSSRTLNCKAIAFETAKHDAADAAEYYQSELGHNQSQQKHLACHFLFDPSRWFRGNRSPLLRV